MRIIPEVIMTALMGSGSDARLSCRSMYDGGVVAETLEVSSWSLSWRLGEQQTIQGSASFTVQDPDGSLAPWGYDEPLSVGGARIQTVFECAGETVALGEWVVTSSEPNESWRLKSGGLQWVHGGATVPVNGADLTQLLDDNDFMSPESPAVSTTVKDEIRRLCGDIIGVQINPDVDNKPIPKNMVYESRINAVADLCRMIGDYRVNGDGLLEVFNPDKPSKPMWSILPGPGGAMITVNRQQNRDSLYNAVVATGQTEDGEELRAYATLETGPLRFDGPFGRKPMEKSSTANTQVGVFADAQETLESQVAISTTVLDVFCLPNPAYEIGDWGSITHPMPDGSTYALVGRCTELTFEGGTDGLAGMKVSLECATDDVLRVARHVRRSQA